MDFTQAKDQTNKFASEIILGKDNKKQANNTKIVF